MQKIIIKNLEVEKFEQKLQHLTKEEMLQNFNSFITKWEKSKEEARKVAVTPKKVVEETTIAPTFFHSEIEKLYQHDYKIPIQYIDEIKSLPRETLISDLNAVIYDSIARFAVFNHTEDTTTTWFPVHALFILCDIQAEKSLEAILDFLSQSEDFLEYWLGDMLTGDIWSVVAVCGKNNLGRLSSFLKETGRYTWARTVVVDAVAQLTHHDIISRQQAVDWLRDLLKYYVENQDVENLIDSSLNGSLVADCLDLEAKELAPFIQQLFDAKVVDEMVAGGWDKVEEEFANPSCRDYKREIESVEKRYTDLKKRDKSESDHKNHSFNNFISQLPLANTATKIGRNDPCTCGSGKKYKKCHGM